jgi:lipoprotein-anchoring transpeptidase ErfK/SrfK
MRAGRRQLIIAGSVCFGVLVVIAAAAQSDIHMAAPPESTSAAQAVEPTPAPPSPAPALAITPETGAVNVDPVGEVDVAATSGTLVDVEMVNDEGRAVAGSMLDGNTRWEPAEPLGYGRSYTLTATAQNAEKQTVKQVSRFSTVVPGHETDVVLGLTSGARIADGGTYGVGTVIVATFDDPIRDRAAAERRMTVTTSPAVDGSWSWINDQKAHWRPREYFSSGTTVTVAANIYGIDLGDGLFGQQDTRVGFRIGPAKVTIADDVTKQISVYQDGALVRTMPTSMGRGGTETVGGKTIAFWTQPGIYTVMEKQNPVLMDSSTYGLPVDSPSGYKISVPHAVRISPDGIYLHEREATVWAQGNTNVSAGCLNLSADNAEWFYNFSGPGDVVEIRNTGGAPLQQWQNGDWSVPWEQWSAGSALRP